MSNVNLAPPPAAGAPAAKPGPGLMLPKSPIGGASGPGSSPMTSPGTGAGMQASARARLQNLNRELMGLTTAFAGDVEHFNDLAAAIRAIGRVIAKSSAPQDDKKPVPVPGAPPGGGMGGSPGGPPTGVPGPGGGAGPIAPTPE